MPEPGTTPAATTPAKPKKENLFGFKGELLLFIPDEMITLANAKKNCPGVPLGIDVKYKEKVKVKKMVEENGAQVEKEVEEDVLKTVFLTIVDDAGKAVTENDDFSYSEGKLTYKTGANKGKAAKDSKDEDVKVDATKLSVGSILKSLKSRISSIERQIKMEQNKDTPNEDTIKELNNKLIALQYEGSDDIIKEEDEAERKTLIAKATKRPYYIMLQKHLLTISKEVGKSVAKVELGENGLEIEKQMFVKKFKMDPKGTGASMIPEKVIIEQFEVDFETGDAKVSVATEPGDDFILNQYGNDFIYLQSAQVIYVRKTKEVTEPVTPAAGS